MPPYPPLQRYFDASAELLEQYNTSEYNPEKAGELLQKAGYTKDAEGKWVDAQGTQLKLEVFVPAFLSGMGLVIVQQLKEQGIDVVPSDPPDFIDRFTKGDYQAAFFGHGGSVNDPYFSCGFTRAPARRCRVITNPTSHAGAILSMMQLSIKST
jgi:peptide/nickel transport system substrate-binding protein